MLPSTESLRKRTSRDVEPALMAKQSSAAPFRENPFPHIVAIVRIVGLTAVNQKEEKVRSG